MNRTEQRPNFFIDSRVGFRIPLHYERIFSTPFEQDIQFAVTSFIDTLPQTPSNSLREHALELLGHTQTDSLFELKMAMNLHSLNEYALVRNDIYQKKITVFLFVSNLFNRGDELMERALPNVLSSSRTNESMVNNMWERGAIGLVKQSKKLQRISYARAFDTIAHLATMSGISTENWNTQLQVMLDAQQKSLQQLSLFIRKGECYTVDDALTYRWNTIGTYAQVLADIFYDDDKMKRHFVSNIMASQAIDDLEDMFEDRSNQVNPFIALLCSHNVWTEYEQRILTSGRLFRTIFSDKYIGLTSHLENKYPWLESKILDLSNRYTTENVLTHY